MGDSLSKRKNANVKELMNHAMQEWSYAKMKCTMQAILSMDESITNPTIKLCDLTICKENTLTCNIILRLIWSGWKNETRNEKFSKSSKETY